MTKLTTRQQQIAELVARGWSNRRIAKELRISEGAVKLRINRILKKHGLSNRYELISESLRKIIVTKVTV